MLSPEIQERSVIADTPKHKIRNKRKWLIKRAEWLISKTAVRASTYRGTHYNRAELASIVWALEIVDEVYGPDDTLPSIPALRAAANAVFRGDEDELDAIGNR